MVPPPNSQQIYAERLGNSRGDSSAAKGCAFAIYACVAQWTEQSPSKAFVGDSTSPAGASVFTRTSQLVHDQPIQQILRRRFRVPRKICAVHVCVAQWQSFLRNKGQRKEPLWQLVRFQSQAPNQDLNNSLKGILL